MLDSNEARLLAACRTAERMAAAAEQVAVAAEMAAGVAEQNAALAELRAETANQAVSAAYARYRAYVTDRHG